MRWHKREMDDKQIMIVALVLLAALAVILVIILMRVILNNIRSGGQKIERANISGGIDVDSGEQNYKDMNGYHGLSGETAYFNRKNRKRAELFLLDCATGVQIRVDIGREEIILGRKTTGHTPGKQIGISDSGIVSRKQCAVREYEGKLYIRHLGKNKTILNGKRLDPEYPAALKGGDIIQVGSARFQVQGMKIYARSGHRS